MNKRGIVISPSFKSTGYGKLEFGEKFDPLELRKYLMYWDEIDCPSNSIIGISSNDIDYLEEVNVVKKTHINLEGVRLLDGRVFIAAQEEAYNRNNSQEPGVWSMAQLSTNPFFTQQTSTVGVDFELHGMLPVPSASTPLEDILEFKEKRNAELLSFRAHLDDVYQKIINSADIPRAKNTEVFQLELAIKDLDKTLNESVIQRTVTNLRNTINLEFMSIAGLGFGTSAGIAAHLAMPPLLAGAAGAGLITTIKVLSMSSSPKTNPSFNYLSSIRSNFNS